MTVSISLERGERDRDRYRDRERQAARDRDSERDSERGSERDRERGRERERFSVGVKSSLVVSREYQCRCIVQASRIVPCPRYVDQTDELSVFCMRTVAALTAYLYCIINIIPVI